MRQLVVLSRVLDEVDGETFSTLEGRITFQKRIYLVQALGLDLGYRFTWNQYGPYSGELAQDGAVLSTSRDEVRDHGSILRLRESARALFSQLRELQEQRPPELSETAWLELLTSVHFLATERGGVKSVRSVDVNAFLEQVVALKPYFALEQVLQAWNRIEGLGVAATAV
jgi:hypothetical protein